MCREEEKEMLATSKKYKRPKIAHNKFANMSKKDWKEANEQSKKTRGVSRLTYEDIFGGRG